MGNGGPVASERPEVSGVAKVGLRAAALGLPISMGRAAPCILPGHADHEASTKRGRDGSWGLCCPACRHWFTFAEARAIVGYASVPYDDSREAKLRGPWRGVRLPGRVEISRWAELLDYEAGLIEPRPIRLGLPDDLTADELVVAKAIRLMLGLRHDQWAGEPFTWARRMSRARTGLTNDRARAAIEGLRERRLIVVVGKAKGSFGGATVYRLGLLIDVLGSEDAIASAIINTFDATVVSQKNRGS